MKNIFNLRFNTNLKNDEVKALNEACLDSTYLKKSLNPVAALVVCAVLWSSGGILIKSIDWNPLAITGGRSVIAAAFMVLFLHHKPVFYIAQKNSRKIDRNATVNLWAGAVCYSLTMILFVTATKMTAAANAVLLQYTNPIWIILLGPALLGEKNRKSDFLALAGVFAGMLLFFAEELGGGSLTGNLLAVCSGFTMALMSIFMRRQKDANPADSFVLSHLLTGVVALPFFFMQPMHNASSGIACLLALGIFQMAVPSMLYSIGITGESALTAMLISMIEPLMNPVWVMLFVHEVPSMQAVTGGLIILGSIAMRSYIQNRQR